MLCLLMVLYNDVKIILFSDIHFCFSKTRRFFRSVFLECQAKTMWCLRMKCVPVRVCLLKKRRLGTFWPQHLWFRAYSQLLHIGNNFFWSIQKHLNVSKTFCKWKANIYQWLMFFCWLNHLHQNILCIKLNCLTFIYLLLLIRIIFD